MIQAPTIGNEDLVSTGTILTGTAVTGTVLTAGSLITTGSGAYVMSPNGINFTTISHGGYSTGMSKAKPEPSSMSPDLPPMYFLSLDDNRDPITLTLQPESSITNIELMRLLMLLVAYAEDEDKFSVYAYVKRHNLERHFTFKS